MNLRTCFRRQCLNWTAGFLLGYALLVSQTLGLMHGVTHVRGGPPSPDTALSHMLPHAHPVSEPCGWLASLFSKHHVGADCRVFDHISQIDILPGTTQVLFPSLRPSFEVAIFEGEALARWAALFDARGPPLTL